jgi:hypothetical protein
MSAVVTRRSLRARGSRVPGRRVLVGAALAVLLVLVVVLAGTTVGTTRAALRDEAGLNTTLGSGQRFDIALVQDGVLRQADRSAVSWAIDGASSLVPGRTATFEVPVVNNGPYDATVQLMVSATGGANNPVHLYRWSVEDAETGEALVGSPEDPLSSTVTVVSLSTAFGSMPLAARTLAPVADGAAWSADPDAPGDHRVLRVTIAYPDTPESERYNGGSTTLVLTFVGESA